jgi:hypothetical protein
MKAHTLAMIALPLIALTAMPVASAQPEIGAPRLCFDVPNLEDPGVAVYAQIVDKPGQTGIAEWYADTGATPTWHFQGWCGYDALPPLPCQALIDTVYFVLAGHPEVLELLPNLDYCF